jgi:hypothetical protein
MLPHTLTPHAPHARKRSSCCSAVTAPNRTLSIESCMEERVESSKGLGADLVENRGRKNPRSGKFAFFRTRGATIRDATKREGPFRASKYARKCQRCA